jgi:hypothetical protein
MNILWMLPIFAGLTLVSWVAYAMGRDAAERQAYQTIATLRGELSAARLTMQRESQRKGPQW